jgi:hypothetical protein
MIEVALYRLCLSMVVGLPGLLWHPAPPRSCPASEATTVDRTVQRYGGPTRKKNGHPRKRQLLLATRE